MRTIIAGAALAVMLAGPAGAAECKVEEFRSRLGIAVPIVEGVSNCERGAATIRAYDGEGEGRKFLGATATRFFGHVFRARIEGLTEDPARLRFKFTSTGR